MAYFTGTAAALKLVASSGTNLQTASTSVAQLESFTIDQNIEMVEVTQLGSNTKSKIPSYKDFTVTLSGHFDYSDAGVKLLQVGNQVDFEIAPSDTTSGSAKYRGRTYVESMSTSTSAGETTKFNATLSGTGALTTTTY